MRESREWRTRLYCCGTGESRREKGRSECRGGWRVGEGTFQKRKRMDLKSNAVTSKSKKFSSGMEKEAKLAQATSRRSDMSWMKAGDKFKSIILDTLRHKVQIRFFLFYWNTTIKNLNNIIQNYIKKNVMPFEGVRIQVRKSIQLNNSEEALGQLPFILDMNIVTWHNLASDLMPLVMNAIHLLDATLVFYSYFSKALTQLFFFFFLSPTTSSECNYNFWAKQQRSLPLP